MTGPGSRAQAAAVLQAVAVSIVGVLPAFLVGALAVQLRADLRVGLAGVGLATAAFFATSSSLARLAGGLVQRVGSRRGLAIAATVAAAALCGVAAAPAYPVLVAALVLGGAGNAMAQPAANLILAELVRAGRLGVAFGVKQSSIPAATLLAGLAVPGIALTVGWRWALVLAALLALGVAGWAICWGRDLRARARADTETADRGLPRGGLVVLTIGGGIAAAACTSLGVFLVDSGVAAGLRPGQSGLLFALSSLLGLSCRVGLGWVADRFPRRSQYVTIANLLTCGAVGYALLAFGTPATFVAGALLAYAAGWAWTGLFHFAIVKDNRQAAASATGFVQTGLSFGAAGGPLVFGLVAEQASYATAWLLAGALSLGGAVTIRTGRRMVRRSRSRQADLASSLPPNTASG